MVWLILMVIAFLIVLVGSLQFLVEAFKESLLWGLACVFIPFAALVFLVMYYERVSKYFFIQLGGFAAMVAIAMMAPDGAADDVLADNPFTRIERSEGEEEPDPSQRRTPFDSVFNRDLDRSSALDEYTEPTDMALDLQNSTPGNGRGNTSNQAGPLRNSRDTRVRDFLDTELNKLNSSKQEQTSEIDSKASEGDVSPGEDSKWRHDRELITAEITNLDIALKSNRDLRKFKVKLHNKAPRDVHAFTLKLFYFDRNQRLVKEWVSYKTGADGKIEAQSTTTLDQFAYSMPFNAKSATVFVMEATFVDGTRWVPK